MYYELEVLRILANIGNEILRCILGMVFRISISERKEVAHFTSIVTEVTTKRDLVIFPIKILAYGTPEKFKIPLVVTSFSYTLYP